MEKLKIGVLISGSGSNLQAIIDACASGRINGEVVFVGSDKPGVFGLVRAEKHGIPTFVVDYAKLISQFKSIEKNMWPEDCDWVEVFRKVDPDINYDYEAVEKLRIRVLCEDWLFGQISRFDFDLLVLAGFMRVLSPYFIDRVNTDPERPRIMNIHPALLPSFPGVDGYGDTIAYGCKVGGSTVHFVDYGEDTGPIIGQLAVYVCGDDLENFKRRGLEAEHDLYPECIQLFAQDRLKVVSQQLPGKKPRKIVKILPD